MIIKKFVFIVTGILLPCLAWGENSTGITGELDTVRVVEFDPNAVAPDSRNRAEAVSVIDVSELRGRSNSLNEIIDRVAGVKIRQTGGLGSESRLSIHGLEGNRIKIFIDGNPIDAPDGNFGINDIPVDFIERIEVYKGYVPARFGSDGMGGAINVVIREFNTNYLDGSYSIGSLNTHRSNWLLKKNFDKQRLEIGTGGFFNHSDNSYDFTVPYTDTVVSRDHDAYTAVVAAVAGKIKNYWFDEIRTEWVYYSNRKEVQGVTQEIKNAFMESRDGVFAFEFKKEMGKLSLELSPTFVVTQGKVIDTAHVQDIGWGLDSIVRPYPIGEVGDGPNLSTSLQKDFQCGFMLEYKFNEDHLLNWNTHGRANWYKNEDSLGSAINESNVAGYPGELYTLVSGLTLESEFLNKRLVNLAGVKAYHFRSNVTESFTGLAARLVSSRSEETSFGFDEGLRFALAKKIFIKAGYQHNLRIPGAEEFFGDGMFIIPNSKLKAEKGNHFHAGLIFDTWDISFITRVQYELNGYYKMIEDMIRLKKGNGSGSAYYNLENVRIKGFDTELKIDFTNWLYAWGNLTLQELLCTNSKDDKTLIRKQVPNIPWFYCNFGVELFKDNLFVKHGAGKIYGSGNFTEEYYFNWKTTTQDKSRMIPGNLTFDAGVEYSLFGSKLSFSADVRNIADKETFDDYHLPLQGRTFAVKVRGSFIK